MSSSGTDGYQAELISFCALEGRGPGESTPDVFGDGRVVIGVAGGALAFL